MSESSNISLGAVRIQRGSLREQVQRQIKELILTNRLRPGQPIVIDQIASEMGVSHTPVREALAMLQNEGLVVIKPYENPRVTGVEPSDVQDAWEMRMLLEGWAVGKAAQVLSREQLDDLEDALQAALRDAQRSRYDSHLKSDIQLHETLLRAADNKLFLRMAQLVSDQSVRIRHLVEAIAPAEQVLEIVYEHLSLLEALRLRDPDTASLRLKSHLEAGMWRTLSALDLMEPAAEG